jgi:hypothetical protein
MLAALAALLPALATLLPALARLVLAALLLLAGLLLSAAALLRVALVLLLVATRIVLAWIIRHWTFSGDFEGFTKRALPARHLTAGQGPLFRSGADEL